MDAILGADMLEKMIPAFHRWIECGTWRVTGEIGTEPSASRLRPAVLAWLAVSQLRWCLTPPFSFQSIWLRSNASSLMAEVVADHRAERRGQSLSIGS
ncbi:hypothetical protein H8A97_25520 [Bradyrhizobium sp. Arg62]|uniref:hypothetical protein n=1 Tax=Bradyrhizobium brasilense TaxID=1419277 RepID=UPI001E49425C|nr:hypothetical protein [Bradyrhizobium brasilense]MCC8948377.1 hypothetical protein [Bradyrhizobium brasilense]